VFSLTNTVNSRENLSRRILLTYENPTEFKYNSSGIQCPFRDAPDAMSQYGK
jgi:hypothetical protein